MSRVKTISSLVVICGLALFFFLDYQTRAKLKAENRVLGQQLQRLLEAQAQVTSTSPPDNALTQEQISELLKLRGEVTQLRAQTNEIALLREQNEKLLASLKDVKPTATNAPAKKRPEDALPQDIHPKNSWAFRGYDSPDATAESMCWAMANGDKSAFMAGLSPEMAAEIEKLPGGKDFGEEMKSNDMGEFRILDRQTLSDDEVVLTMYTTRRDEKTSDYIGGAPENTTFKNIGGQWKIMESGPQK